MWAKPFHIRSGRTLGTGAQTLFLCGILVALGNRAVATDADICAQAAALAAAETGVPYAVLMAITQTETGRTSAGVTQPWPWTINLEGEGHWFENQDEALAFAYQALRADRVSFDTGCFQINYRWHGENFSSLEEMFDPARNAAYAALFLSDLYAELGDWSLAAGAYHSRTEVHASRYRARFDEFYAVARQVGPPVITAGASGPLPTIPRANSYPLLQPGGDTGQAAAQLGSLVPVFSGN